MASTLRPHRSPSPTPPPPSVNPSNPAKLTRQSLGPPTTTNGAAARGFAGLGIAGGATGPSGVSGQPRHASSSVALGSGAGIPTARESLSPRPSLGATHARPGVAGRPSSEFIPSGAGRETRTPEAEHIDQWFQHLASWETTLEEMAAASTDQNFTEELGAIEQWFRVLSEAERTAALYSLLQHSTPVQIRFFLSVLHHMAQSDPMTALLSPNPMLAGNPSFGAQMEAAKPSATAGLKSPSAGGGGAGFSGSPYLATDDKARAAAARQNRISAPGTLASDGRWASQLDQVIERGASPGVESSASGRSRSPGIDIRPKSTDFAGAAHDGASYPRSPRQSSGLGVDASTAAAGLASPASPLLSGNWASMVNTPVVPMFTDPKIDNLGAAINAQLGRVNLDDPTKYRRPGAGTGSTSRNVSGASGQYDDAESGRGSPYNVWPRSPVLPGTGEFGLGGGMGDPSLAGLGMNFAGLGGLGMGGGNGINAATAAALGGLGINQLNANAMHVLAMAQAQAQAQAQLNTAASFASSGYGGGPGGLNLPRGGGQRQQGGPGAGRKSPLLGAGGMHKGSHSPSPMRDTASAAQGGGGAGGGAGVAGPEDVDIKVLEDTSNWLRVLRLHKYTTNFETTPWRDMVAMVDKDLQDKGVAAQGARSKFLKVFYNVRTKFDMPHPEGQEEYAPGAVTVKEEPK